MTFSLYGQEVQQPHAPSDVPLHQHMKQSSWTGAEADALDPAVEAAMQ